MSNRFGFVRFPFHQRYLSNSGKQAQPRSRDSKTDSASTSGRKFVHIHCFFGVLKGTDFKISRWVRNRAINSESFAKDFVPQLCAKCYNARR